MPTFATTWGLGDYPAMARLLMPAAEAVVAAAEVGPNDRVLDVATGTGNAAERDRLVAQGRWEAMRADLRSFVGERGVTDGDLFRLEFEYLVMTATPGPAS
ncbi:hypothetical protein [Micromonospora parathelypteridis]|uniref:Uncharacterized protein n=1 Tax=Micromonospora parathelypteridis TaxID=1839617 RepID=A0A840WD62_9ACTN|nr:hypothetical protein [Micromonospora parathelypteridis]MBB5480941.1 hypothetical protein [Micromonospora parathelypteridis]GGO20863.1 hypothetical protein GCM10011576_38600 [Micromonospora parathelypteridis]